MTDLQKRAIDRAVHRHIISGSEFSYRVNKFLGGIPRYTESIACAWEAASRLPEIVPSFRRFEVHFVENSWAVMISVGEFEEDEGYAVVEEAATAPLAICLAALRAVGYESESGEKAA